MNLGTYEINLEIFNNSGQRLPLPSNQMLALNSCSSAERPINSLSEQIEPHDGTEQKNVLKGGRQHVLPAKSTRSSCKDNVFFLQRQHVLPAKSTR